MQFRDLKKQYQVLKQDMDAALTDTAASAAFIMGKPVKELEAELAAYVGVKHCVSCANGTDALTPCPQNVGHGKEMPCLFRTSPFSLPPKSFPWKAPLPFS